LAFVGKSALSTFRATHPFMSSLLDEFDTRTKECEKAIHDHVAKELGNNGIRVDPNRHATEIFQVVLPYRYMRLRQAPYPISHVGEVAAKVALALAKAENISSLERVKVEIARDSWQVAYDLVIALWEND
jgi:hypothetical protein